MPKWHEHIVMTVHLLCVCRKYMLLSASATERWKEDWLLPLYRYFLWKITFGQWLLVTWAY
jgi:hypothetical protein